MNEPQYPPPRRPHPLARPSAAPPPEPPSPPRRYIPVPMARPALTYVLLAVITLAFVAQLVSGAQQPNPLVIDPVSRQFMKINERVIDGGEYYRLLTAMFLHGSVAHLFFNGYALYVIGVAVERLFGTARFAIIYFLGGLTGSLASLIFTPSPSLGASGAIFALLAAEGVYLYRHRHLFGALGRSRFGNIVFIALINLVFGFIPNTNIDNWGHLGGLFGGLALAWLIGPRLKIEPPAFGDAPKVVDTNPPARSWAVGLLYGIGLALVLILVAAGQ